MKPTFVVTPLLVTWLALAAPSFAADEPTKEPRTLEKDEVEEIVQNLRFSSKRINELRHHQDAKGATINLWDAAVSEPITSPGKDVAGWALSDPASGQQGTRTEKAYAEHNLKTPTAPIVVAVIDDGIDLTHEDLKDKAWVNLAEAGGKPGVDDDGDGYVDDINGWNFLGGQDGAMVYYANLEVTREFVRLQKKKTEQELTLDEKRLFDAYAMKISTARKDAQLRLDRDDAAYTAFDAAMTLLKSAGLKDESLESVRAFAPANDAQRAAQEALITTLDKKHDRAWFIRVLERTAFLSTTTTTRALTRARSSAMTLTT